MQPLKRLLEAHPVGPERNRPGVVHGFLSSFIGSS
jgi:hypothetical protein